jgi:hypothetical protein
MLPDGVRLRGIRPEDKPLLQEALTRLSRESIERRFLAAKPRFTDAELRYLTEVDGHELAVLVGDCWQRRGIGTELARALTAAMGVARISGTMLATNRAALRLMRGIGPLESSYMSGGVREVVAHVGAPVAMAA